MVNQYEVTFIVTPALSDSDVKKTIKGYSDFIKKSGGKIVHEDHWGLKQMAYPIKKKTTGIYHWMEFKAPADTIEKLELSYRRDENILRFMTVKLDKYSLEYNEKKRKGLIGVKKKEGKSTETEEATGAKTDKKTVVVEKDKKTDSPKEKVSVAEKSEKVESIKEETPVAEKPEKIDVPKEETTKAQKPDKDDALKEETDVAEKPEKIDSTKEKEPETGATEKIESPKSEEKGDSKEENKTEPTGGDEPDSKKEEAPQEV